MAKRYEAIVVGGGAGGLACAALLARWGLKPLLLEKNERVGGKAMTVSSKGFSYELWPILQVPMRGPSLETVFKELGVESELRPIYLERGCLSYRNSQWDKYKTVVTHQTEAGTDPNEFFGLFELNAQERERALAILTDIAMMPLEKLNALDDMTFEEYLAQYEVPTGLYSYLAMHSNASLAEPIDLVSASEQVRILQQIALSGGGGYYAGGFGRVLSVLAKAIEARGGEVRTRIRVEKIDVEGGRVQGVIAGGEEFKASIVISNVGIQPTVLKLVGEEYFDKSYVNYVRNLAPGWGFTGVRYFLSKPVMKHAMYLAYADDSWWNMDRFLKVKAGHVPDEILMFMVVPANFDPAMAPSGKQCIISGTICSPDPEAKEIRMLWDRMDDMLARLWPEVPPVIESKQQAGPAQVSALTRDHVLEGQGGECVGLGQIVGQCGKYKPSPKAPINGLFYVGCDAGGAGIGTHQAVESGIKVAKTVFQYHRVRQAMQQK